MRPRQATLGGMDRDRLMAWVADVVLDKGGDWEATFAVLRAELDGTEPILEDDDLTQGMLFAGMLLDEYAEPGLGPDVVRARRDRRRRLVPAQPAGAPGRGWWGRRSAS